MTAEKNQPIEKIRDGALVATIWGNTTAQGKPFYAAEFSRTYKDANGNYRESSTFSNSELLRLAHLAGKVYDRLTALRSSSSAG